METNTKTPKINCINIAYIFKTSLGSINGSWTEGNVSTVKKITLPDGRLLPYVSGQSIKYQIRKGLNDLGLSNQFSPTFVSSNSASVNVTSGIPAEYIDDDLFGYLNPKGEYKDGAGNTASVENTIRRTAPVRTSAAIGIFPYRGDRDLGTKSKEQGAGNSDAGGNIFETEIYYNYFKVNILIEVDRIGRFLPSELAATKKGNTKNLEVAPEIRKARLTNLFKAISQLWGGGKQSRLLTDMSPKFLAITFQTSKSPIFLECLSVSESEELDIRAIKEVLSDNQSIVNQKFLGVRSGIFKNISVPESEATVGSALEGVVSIQTAFDNALKELETLNF